MENSNIPWCDHTLNFWMGCSHAIVPESVSITGKAHESPECKTCYAEQMMDDRFGKVVWGKNGTRSLVKSATANARKWNKQAKLTGDRPRVFCQSLADTFEKFEGLDEWRMELLNLITECDRLEWLLLSKHLFDRMANGEDWRDLVPESWRDRFPDHVRIGCTGGTQETYDYRVSLMQKIPAKNFVSVEPMFEPIDLMLDHNRVDWVIVGGESQQGREPARKFDMSWAANCFVQCRHDSAIAKPAFFFKQAGSNPHYFGKPVKLGDRNGEDLSDPQIPEINKVREFPVERSPF
jgi:protein gp37